MEELSVESIARKKAAMREGKLHGQASNNVARQSFAKDMREKQAPPPGPLPSFQPKQPEAPKSAPKKTAKKDSVDDQIAELNKIATVVKGYYASPVLGPRIQHIPRPTRGTIEEYKLCLDEIRCVLNAGLSHKTVATGWLQIMIMIDPLLANLPPQVAVPLGSSNYAAARMETLLSEFEEISIEYGSFFAMGPLPRLAMGTMRILAEYKGMHARAMEQQQQQQQPQTEETTEDPEKYEPETSHVKLPPPSKIYPEPIVYPPCEYGADAYPPISSEETRFNEIKKDDFIEETKPKRGQRTTGRKPKVSPTEFAL